MSVLLEILIEFAFQVVGEIVAEILYGVGDIATHGRMKRVALFAAAGAAAGVGSYFVRPRPLFPDAFTRYGAIAALALGGGLFLAFVDARVLRGRRGAATAGFLSGTCFSIAYAGARHLLLT